MIIQSKNLPKINGKLNKKSMENQTKPNRKTQNQTINPNPNCYRCYECHHHHCVCLEWLFWRGELAFRQGIESCGGWWLCVRESSKEIENLREISEILKRKRECDIVWMDERERERERVYTSLGWERAEKRETWEEIRKRESWEAR